MRDFQLPGRSPVRAMDAMVATSHPLASAAALSLLQEGGNAIDAAICASAVLAVVEPQSTGIGGDCFCLYVPGGVGPVLAYNGAGRAPEAATIDWYEGQGFTEIPADSPHAVTIPGAIDAWCRLSADHGRTPLDRVFAPAIHYAEAGYVIHDRVEADWHEARDLLAQDATAARIFLPGGGVPRAGDVHRQLELARSLRLIAAGGREVFYEGELAEDLVAHLRSVGGLHTLDDFAAAGGDYAEPVSTTYRGIDVWQMPPSNQGLTALVMLNLLSGFDLTGLDPLGAERLHLEIEAGRLAYRIRDELIADPDHADVPVKALLAPSYADGLRRRIDPDIANRELPSAVMEPSDTVYLSVVDRDRNAVSFINSTYHSFGSGLVGPKSGIVLQNRGKGFRVDRGHPNCIAPRKRPLHTIMPGMATRNGRVIAPFGVMGGDYQPFGNVHVLSNLLDYGMDPQAAIDLPRVFYEKGELLAERGVPAATLRALEARGHRVGPAEEPLGGGQMVLIDWDRGTLTGGSDPRKDGLAIGY
ncbi:gamma-glutamyltransferase [Labrys sp. KNU-23]|uniref:gamma-glutamyltransferase n=1 Tax=Labrys sp. KNU-23 TaxID=2789216 RepID=UPI0011EC725E|nr:gamma-glutamyltransferase [Labrys sp. KNU-23]QEN86666.1 gamma-glutamyltransferase [Labrys sp. KNU-23]